MCIQKNLAVCIGIGALHCGIGLAQTNANQSLFRVTFSATCQGFEPDHGRLVTTRITDRTIVAQATGVNPSGGPANRQFALVFNAAEDSLQVADAQGKPVVDVVHFGGGAATGDARQTQRLTFMFFPGQTNEFGAETNVIGTALITERASRGTRANITGKLQFALTSGTALGTTNLPSGTNVQVCAGAFTTGGVFPSSTAGAGTAPTTATTGITGVNVVSSSNGVTSVTSVTNPNGTTPGAVVNGTTPLVVITTPITTFPVTGTGTTTTGTFLPTTAGILPSLTGNGSLPDLGTQIGTGTVTTTPLIPSSASIVPTGTGTTVLTSPPSVSTIVPAGTPSLTGINTGTGSATIVNQ